MVPAKTQPVSNSTRWGSVTLRIMLGHVNWICGGPRISKKQGYFMIFHDISWYFMICQYISWYVSIFHDISMVSWYFMAVKRWCCCHRTQRLRPRPTEVPVPLESWTCWTWGYPKSSKSRPFWHWIPWWFGDPPEAKPWHFQHPKVHPESRPGAPIGPQGVVGAIFLVPTRIY